MSAVDSLTKLISGITMSLFEIRETRPPTSTKRTPLASPRLDFRHSASSFRFQLVQDIRLKTNATLPLGLHIRDTDTAANRTLDAAQANFRKELAQLYEIEVPFDKLDASAAAMQNRQDPFVPVTVSTSNVAQFTLAVVIGRSKEPQQSGQIPNNDRTSPPQRLSQVDTGIKPILYTVAVILLAVAALLIASS
jgi:hypothetical protein